MPCPRVPRHSRHAAPTLPPSQQAHHTHASPVTAGAPHPRVPRHRHLAPTRPLSQQAPRAHVSPVTGTSHSCRAFYFFSISSCGPLVRAWQTPKRAGRTGVPPPRRLKPGAASVPSWWAVGSGGGGCVVSFGLVCKRGRVAQGDKALWCWVGHGSRNLYRNTHMDISVWLLIMASRS